MLDKSFDFAIGSAQINFLYLRKGIKFFYL